MQCLQMRAVLAGLCLGASLGMTCPLRGAGQTVPTLRRVAARGGANNMAVEILASGPVTPRTQAVTGPDRIVIDLPNALPGSAPHRFPVNRGKVKGVRIGLFSANPPVTRVVIDLKSAQPYQVVSAGNHITVKLSGDGAPAGGFSTEFEVVKGPGTTLPRTTAAAEVPAQVPPPRRIRVEFRNGKLSIWADKVTLAELLNEVHRKTGAAIPIPAGAEQELVVADMGPGQAREVLAELLNGSRFNFIMVGAKNDPTQLRSVLLSPKGGMLRPAVDYAPAAPMARGVPMPAPEEEPNAPEPPGAAEPPADPEPPQR